MPTSKLSASKPKALPLLASEIEALSQGLRESKHLAESLAVDQKTLLDVVFPDRNPALRAATEAACELKILHKTRQIGLLLWESLGEDAFQRASTHPSDTVRSWACFMVQADSTRTLPERLRRIQPLADDGHFGVREWAWMALRPHLVDHLEQAFALLLPWTASPSPYVRRFASEVTRPKGVWCAHLKPLRKDPSPGLPLLEALKADPHRYVQDSVANWLNDAAKDHPEWVQGVCRQWLKDSPTPATQRICQRAQRSLKSPQG